MKIALCGYSGKTGKEVYKLLEEDGIIVYEHDAKKVYNSDNFEIIDSKKYGTIIVDYMRVKDV